MPATITVTVIGINNGPNNTALVTFQLVPAVQGEPALTPLTTTMPFPADEGKEFELGDSYTLPIAPGAENIH